MKHHLNISRKTKQAVVVLATASCALAALAPAAGAAHFGTVTGRPGFFQPSQTQGELINFGNMYVNYGAQGPRVCASPASNGPQIVTLRWNLFKARAGAGSWTLTFAPVAAVTVQPGACVYVQFANRIVAEYAWYTVNWEVWWQTPGGSILGYEAYKLDDPADYALAGAQYYLGVTGFYLGRGAMYL